MALAPLNIIIPLRIISQLLYDMLIITISRENSQSALITLSTPGRLNSLIRCKHMNKDVSLNHNGFSISDLSVIAEVFPSPLSLAEVFNEKIKKMRKSQEQYPF